MLTAVGESDEHSSQTVCRGTPLSFKAALKSRKSDLGKRVLGGRFFSVDIKWERFKRGMVFLQGGLIRVVFHYGIHCGCRPLGLVTRGENTKGLLN